MKPAESCTVCVPFPDIRFAVEKAIRWANESRGMPYWETGLYVFEEEYNAKVIHDSLGITTFILFNSEEDFTAFMLRWS